jgi:hypothetical protein
MAVWTGFSWINMGSVVFCGLVVIMLVTGPKVRRFKPGPERWKGDENPQHDFLRRGSKAVGPMS